MRRRDFLTLLSATAAWPGAAWAQQRGKPPTIGFLGSATPETWSPWVAAFEQQLLRHGRINGRTVVIEYRWGDGRLERYAEIAAEFVRLKVDVIVTGGAPTYALKQATSTIPIIGAIIGDPVGTGLVGSLARPGGNITGLSYQSTDVTGKRVDLLLQAIPGFKRLAVLGNVGAPQVGLEMREVDTAAKKLGLEVLPLQIRRAEDIAAAIPKLKGGVEALYVCTEPLSNANRVQINALAVEARLPTMHGTREYVEAGGLMSYGANFPDLFRRAADYVDKILSGTPPGEIPIEQPTAFDFVVNLTTSKALGLAIPASLLSLAEIIE
jgi:putative ABC transport system substrate-binding protein